MTWLVLFIPIAAGLKALAPDRYPSRFRHLFPCHLGACCFDGAGYGATCGPDGRRCWRTIECDFGNAAELIIAVGLFFGVIRCRLKEHRWRRRPGKRLDGSEWLAIAPAGVGPWPGRVAPVLGHARQIAESTDASWLARMAEGVPANAWRNLLICKEKFERSRYGPRTGPRAMSLGIHAVVCIKRRLGRRADAIPDAG
jgi:hypothetical protein